MEPRARLPYQRERPSVLAGRGVGQGVLPAPEKHAAGKRSRVGHERVEARSVDVAADRVRPVGHDPREGTAAD